MGNEPKVGDRYEKNGVTVCVHRVERGFVFCGRWSGTTDDLVKISLGEWNQQIGAAKKIEGGARKTQ